MRFNNDNTLRSYLLGTLPQEQAERLEERLLKDDEIVEQLSLIEDELIEDYARNALNASEREQFEKYFLSSPKRRRKLRLVRGLRKYTVDIGHVSTVDRTPARRWYFPLLSPQWAAAAAVVLVAFGGFMLWRVYFNRDDVDKGLIALNEAYKTKRPVEARVSGLDYAPYSPTRGPNDVNSRELDRSAALLQNAVNEQYSPEALHALGRFHLFKRDFDKASGEFEEALKAKPNDATIHSDLGAALFEKGKLERATDQSGRGETTLARSLEHLNRALELNDSLLDARFNRALLYEEMRLTPQALDDWNKYVTLDANSRWAEEARRRIEELKKRSEKVSQRNDDQLVRFFEARAAGDREKSWQVFSNAHLRTGNTITNKLIDNYLNAVTAPAPSSQAAAEPLDTLTELGKLSSDKTGDRFTADVAQIYRSAAASQQQSLAQARKDIAAGYKLNSQAKNDLAISLFDRAKAVFTAEGDHPEALLASFWLSFCNQQRGETQTSLSIAEQAYRECEARGYKWLGSIMQIALANGRRQTTEYSEAIELASASYETSKQLADKNGELRSLNVLADLYRIVGNYRRALYTAQQGRDLGIEIFADPSQMVGFHAVSARSLMLLGHYSAALEYQKQTVILAEAMNNPLARSRYRVQMGMVLEKLKNYDEAIRNIRLGIEAGQSVSDETSRKEMSTYAQVYLARVYRELGNFNDALGALAEAENFVRPTDKQVWLLHEVKKEQLLTRIAQGDVAGAKEELARVLSDYEDQRLRILEESNRSSFFDQEQSIYDVAIDFARAHSNPNDAFDYSERSRGRSLLDASAEGWQVADKGGVPEPRFSSAIKPAPLDQLQKELPEQVQLLQFAVLKDKLIAWYLTRDRFETATVNVTSDALRTKVDRLLNIVASPANDNEQQLQRFSTELYDLLIAPLAQYLDAKKELVVVPDKMLNLLPFNALLSSSSQKYLVEDFALTYASSANVFVHDTVVARKKSLAANGDEKLLGVGNPSFDRKAFPGLDDLPSASREVEEISHFYHPEVLLRGDEAKKASVLSEMRTADVLHLATHYLPDTNSPMLGRLLLVSEPRANDHAQSANGVLQAYEIYRLKPLNARLAILAGCQTGVEDYVNGEGPIGLARPFKAAGVPLVVASLWPVDSQATTELMIQFHRLRKEQHYSSAEALRAAQVQMLKQGSPDHRSPYYWASFSLTGGYSDY